MKRNILFLFLIGIIINSVAQIAPDKYYIQFTDKNNSPYSIDNPGEFLTQRAIDRRNRQGISISENDIPVNITYLQGVAEIGVDLLNSTRWLNGVTIYTTNPAHIEQIEALPYVSSTVKFNYSENFNSEKFIEINTSETNTNYETRGQTSANSLDYGLAFGQINQLNGIPLHDDGYQGESMIIAVLDAGFTGVDIHPVFEYLWDNARILGSKDFVYIGGSVFTNSEHGKAVLSCMGGNLPGEMIGTAPEASYWLLRSEEPSHENIIEEYNWMSAAEFADSVGADVINSSLIYIDFDNPVFDHPYEAMNGDSTVITRAADLAASKGILVVNGAGNSGNSSVFPWIGAPADGDSVFSIGAVDLNDQRAYFSSIGPTADGRIKPTVMACGYGTTIAVGNNEISNTGNGTSLSSPIMAGMAACLWESQPNMSAIEIQEAIKQSGSYASNPNDYMGWGIPDFNLANSILEVNEISLTYNEFITASPNPFTNKLYVTVNIDSDETVRIELINSAGNILLNKNYSLTKYNNNFELNTKMIQLSQGIYFIKVITKHKTDIIKIIKN